MQKAPQNPNYKSSSWTNRDIRQVKEVPCGRAEEIVYFHVAEETWLAIAANLQKKKMSIFFSKK